MGDGGAVGMHVGHLRGAQRAQVTGLAAALREEGGAVERYGKAAAALFAREDARGEFSHMRVGVKQLFGHGIRT